MNQNDVLTALGPLAPLYEDPTVTEIMVDGPDSVYIERRGQLEDTGIRFDGSAAIQAVIEAALVLGGVSPGPQQTTVEVRLTNSARLIAALPPTAVNGPTLIIRKMPAVPLAWDKLIEWGAISRDAYELLQSAVRAHASLLIAGDTGSGKTTVINLLAGSVPPTERLVVVEEIHEMQIRHPRCVVLEAGGPANLSMSDLLVTAARMRPDWLIAGELRGPEAMRVMQIVGSGHSSMMTLHATSPEDALARLETMCLMANLGLGLGEIRAIIAAALRLITFQRRQPDGRRQIVDIVELRGVENSRYILQPLFRYNADACQLEATGATPGWQTK